MAKEKIIKLTVIALLVAFTTNVYASEVYQQSQSNFLSITGEITETDGDIITVEGEQGTVRFDISGAVFFGFELSQEATIGQTVTGYFLAGGAMPLIYPPQYNITVLVSPQAEHSIKVDLFTDRDGMLNQLVSLDNQLIINIENAAVVIDYNFETFEGDLAGRNLIVVYNIATRSIPAITNPELVMVLPVTGITPEVPHTLPDPDQLQGLMPTFPTLPYAPDWSNYPVIIEGVGLADTNFHMTENDVFVPLRRVAESMGAIITWNEQTQMVEVNNNITLTIGSNEFSLDGENVTLHSEAQLINGTTYVPISFFRELLGFNNAYFEGGHVHINNYERME